MCVFCCCFFLFKQSKNKQSRLIWWLQRGAPGYWSKMAHQHTGPACGKLVRDHVFLYSLQGHGLGFAQSCLLMSHWPELSHMASSSARKAGKCSLNLENVVLIWKVMGTAKIWELYYRRKEGRVGVEFTARIPGAMHTACRSPPRTWQISTCTAYISHGGARWV